MGEARWYRPIGLYHRASLIDIYNGIHACAIYYIPVQGQGQGHGGQKVAKIADVKVYLLEVA